MLLILARSVMVIAMAVYAFEEAERWPAFAQLARDVNIDLRRHAANEISALITPREQSPNISSALSCQPHWTQVGQAGGTGNGMNSMVRFCDVVSSLSDGSMCRMCGYCAESSASSASWHGKITKGSGAESSASSASRKGENTRNVMDTFKDRAVAPGSL
jgi:hypothetical protein